MWQQIPFLLGGLGCGSGREHLAKSEVIAAQP